jgi:hypothetical protein
MGDIKGYQSILITGLNDVIKHFCIYSKNITREIHLMVVVTFRTEFIEVFC